MEKLKFDILSTPWGFVAAAVSRHGLRHVLLPEESKPAAFEALCRAVREEKLVPDNKTLEIKQLAVLLKRYFTGRPTEFKLTLDFDTATVFQRQVWCITRTIPFGTTRTYGWIAEMLGDPAARRAVGQALNANPLPLLVPCHRVIAADGKLGGFSGKVELKSRLLRLEHVILT